MTGGAAMPPFWVRWIGLPASWKGAEQNERGIGDLFVGGSLYYPYPLKLLPEGEPQKSKLHLGPLRGQKMQVI